MKIIVDSCVDFNPKVFTEKDITKVPFKVTIDGVEYSDQGDTVIDVLRKQDYKSHSIQTACPSPGEFYEAMQGYDQVFVVTISSKLSGSYQAAQSARQFYLEESEKPVKVHVFDSKSAAAGEVAVTLKIMELMEQDTSFEDIVIQTENYIDAMHTYFSLDSLDTLVSGGRVSRTEQLASKALRLFPIMGDDGDGNIERKALVRGAKNILPKMVELLGDIDSSLRRLIITHVDAPERAQGVKELAQEHYNFKEIFLMEASGLSSVYASKGGIILAF